MSGLVIAAPLPATVIVAQSSAGAGLADLLTPDPREGYAAAAPGDATISLDLGSVQPIDTLFLGYTNRPAGAVVDVYAGLAGSLQVGSVQCAGSYRRAPLRHAVLALDQPVEDRYFRLVSRGPGLLVAGVVAAGLAIRVDGYEPDWGRPIIDMTRVERQQLGGFSVDPGVAAGGFQWTMPGLTDEQRDRLYALQLDLGTGGTLLVAETTDAGPALNEALHWGLLTKLEPFARQSPGASKWTMQVQDWA